MKIKTNTAKLPKSIYVIFSFTVVANVIATVIVLKYFL